MSLDELGALCRLPGVPEAHEGTRVRRARLGNTHPWNRYFNRRLSFQAPSIAAVVGFLRDCRYAHDRATRSHDDFWEPPDEFEHRRAGDCEDHALWAWRQLVDLGYRSRFVIGDRHAWVHLFLDDAWWLLESTYKGTARPQPSAYLPRWSVERTAPKRFEQFAHFRPELGVSSLQAP